MACNCYRRIRKKPCKECLRADSIIIDPDGHPAADGGTVDIDLEVLTNAPDSCGVVNYTVYSYDDVFVQPTIDSNNVITIQTTNPTTYDVGELYKVIIKAECSSSYLGTYFTIKTQIQ